MFGNIKLQNEPYRVDIVPDNTGIRVVDEETVEWALSEEVRDAVVHIKRAAVPVTAWRIEHLQWGEDEGSFDLSTVHTPLSPRFDLLGPANFTVLYPSGTVYAAGRLWLSVEEFVRDARKKSKGKPNVLRQATDQAV